MVERVTDPSGRDCHWIIRPNQSLSWRRAVQVYTAITGVVLGIGLVFAWHGYWPVLPFAGLEILVLGVAFYTCLSRSQVREVVTITRDTISVQRGRKRPEEYWECPRAWARINMERAPIAWYPSRLSVAFQGRQIEIGRFLSEMERQHLAVELQGMVRSYHWQPV